VRVQVPRRNLRERRQELPRMESPNLACGEVPVLEWALDDPNVRGSLEQRRA